VNARDFDGIKGLTWGQSMYRRANAIKRYLVRRGINADRIIPRIGNVYPANANGAIPTHFMYK
jgi:hypothetical protein